MPETARAGREAPKLLVVDDDDDLRRTLLLQLQPLYTVFEAASGREALTLIKRERPRLMFLDMSMPGMDGLETLACARTIDKSLIVIMLTGENDLAAARRALESGALEYVTKPFDAAYLREEVGRLLSGAAQAPADRPPWRIVD